MTLTAKQESPFLPARYVWETTIDDVVHKEITVGGKKAADGSAELFMESAGWYFVMAGFSYYFGDEKPAFQKGDKIRMTIERRP